VSAPLRRTCARCLEPFVEEVIVPVEEEFLPSFDAGGAPLALEQDGDAFRIDEHNEIDLGPALHDELSLTEPMHPLCRPECAGLCPVCGVRLTGAAHDHGGEELDPRLAALRRLLDEPED
jgi:uncharacterized protein